MKNILTIQNTNKHIGYFSLFTLDSVNYLLYNVYPKASECFDGIPGHHGSTFILNMNTNEELEIVKDSNCLSHNFTIINVNEKLYGLGGLCLKKRADKLLYGLGVYLVNLNNDFTYDEKEIKNVIVNKQIKEGPNIMANKLDSNLCVFYSSIKNKYLLYTRYNLKQAQPRKPGVRLTQVFSSSDLINWEESEIIKIDDLDKDNDIYYQFKVIESLKHGIFFATSSYINLVKNKNYVKLLISYDGVNWKGIEKIVKTEKKEHEACSKLQPIGMIINDDILNIYIQDGYFDNKTNVVKHEYNILSII